MQHGGAPALAADQLKDAPRSKAYYETARRRVLKAEQGECGARNR